MPDYEITWHLTASSDEAARKIADAMTGTMRMMEGIFPTERKASIKLVKVLKEESR